MSKEEVLFSGTKHRNKALEMVAHRALDLLRGLGTNPELFDQVAAGGYTVEIHKKGFALLEAATGYGGTGKDAPDANPTTVAIKNVSDWYGPAFDRVQAALTHLHPEQASYVFTGLVKVTGVASVVAAAKFLERIEDLGGTGPGAEARKAFAAEDKEAMATIVARGFDAKELKRVRELVEVAHTATAKGAPVVDEDLQEKRLLALKAWYDDWSSTAHALIKKRSDLIRLGLAHRQDRKEAEEPTQPAAPATPATPATTPHS